MSLDVAAGLLTCPHCRGVLVLEPGQARCPAGHTFDVARQGHLNLLARPQPKNADTAAMLEARSRVLRGLYADVVALVADTAATLRPRVVVDAGAGTGQYLAAVIDALPQAVGIATDVSVAAARRAASAHPRLASVVADTWRGLPVVDSAADLVLCVFAPRNPADFARLLPPGGHLLVVTPEPGHLAQLRATYGLLDLDPDKDTRLEQSLAGLFSPLASTRLSRGVAASANEVADVVAMGPNAFHGARETGPATVEIDVRCRTYRRLENAAHGERDLRDREEGEDER
ncbi:MAG TPA: methyltransferase domain-containing protein [Propionibacteriaceae bacterium]|nr:methyltransferase domain-containing protein [Propionibacteriaceae bacterium]